MSVTSPIALVRPLKQTIKCHCWDLHGKIRLLFVMSGAYIYGTVIRPNPNTSVMIVERVVNGWK